MNFTARFFYFLGFNILTITLVQAVCLFDNSQYRSLIADRKAYLPGDLLTVIVTETSNAQSSTDLASTKELKAALEASYPKHHINIQAGLGGKGRSAAKTARNGRIRASLTVQIIEVLPNGSYKVAGHQQIKINGEQQNIILEGVVRNEDISAQNTLLSTRLANAHIIYSGQGSVSNSERHNILYKIFSFLGIV